MTQGPWDDWIPGVLSKKQVRTLADRGFILDASPDAADYDYSSLDVRLANEAYVLVGGCVKPFGAGYLTELMKQERAERLQPDAEGAFLLSRRKSYLFRIKERIAVLKGSPIYGMATAKSSVGRMDVLARLVVDGMDEYEGFRPSNISSGDIFLEVTPMTFDVRVKPGTSLTQLRLFKGHPRDCLIQGRTLLRTVLDGGEEDSEPTLSVDLRGCETAGHEVVAFSADFRELQDRSAIPLWKVPDDQAPRPWDHWRFAFTDKNRRLRIEKDKFYIIQSYEKIHLPEGVAVYCRASDETIGEMRIHYAGFVHPFFGCERKDETRGTPLIFEVRGHDIDVSLRHREKMARLEFYRMSQDASRESDRESDPYANQALKLSKFFAPWPEKADCGADGKVTPL